MLARKNYWIDHEIEKKYMTLLSFPYQKTKFFSFGT